MMVFAVALVVLSENGFRVKMNQDMGGGFQHRKIAAWVNEEVEIFVSLVDGPLELLEVCDREKGLQQKESELEICWKTFSKMWQG